MPSSTVTRTLVGSADLASPVAIEYATTNELYTLKCNQYDCISNGFEPAMLPPTEDLNVPVVGCLYHLSSSGFLRCYLH